MACKSVKWRKMSSGQTLFYSHDILPALSPPLPPHPLFTPRVYEGSDFMLIPFERHVSDVSFLDGSPLIRALAQTAGRIKTCVVSAHEFPPDD